MSDARRFQQQLGTDLATELGGGFRFYRSRLEQPSPDLAREMKGAIEGIAFPFFERFCKLSAARDAVASEDGWCFGGRGPFWRSLCPLPTGRLGVRVA